MLEFERTQAGEKPGRVGRSQSEEAGWQVEETNNDRFGE